MARSRTRFDRIHAVKPRDARDKLTLAIAFFTGVAGGVALKVLGVHPFVAAGFSAIVLIGYAALSYYGTHLQLEPETIGDNCYYLGFLFTLTALAVTLYFVVRGDASSRADLIPEVISGFGVALSSTIMGVFLRVLMMQFRADLVTRERQTRTELDMATRTLRDDMVRSIRQIKSYTIEALQLAAEHDQAMRNTTMHTLEDFRTELLGSAKAFQQQLRKSVEAQTTASISSIEKTVLDASRKALDVIADGHKELKAQTSAIRREKKLASEELKANSDILSVAYNRLIADAKDYSESLARIADQLEKNSIGMKSSIDAVENSLLSTEENIKQSFVRIGEITQEFSDRIEVALSVANRSIKEISLRTEADINFSDLDRSASQSGN